MRLYFLKDFDGYEKGKHYFVEVSLGRRIWEKGAAIPYQQYLDEKYEAERREKEQKAKELAAKKDAEAPKQRATSKRASTRKKAVK